jgi:PKD repeat protein
MNNMKRFLLPLLFLAFITPAMSQGWVYITGTVTDLASGFPIPNHAVTIMSDSTNGNFYYNVVYTDSAGYYYDDVPVITDSTGFFYVQTLDCQNYLHREIIYINPNSNTYTQDFQICDLVIPCQAAFIFYADSSSTPPFNYYFIDQSTGNITNWYWEFGDGQYSAEQSPYHSYEQAGTYTVCLNVSSSDSSCYDYFCETIVIEGSSGCQAYYTYYPSPQGSPDSFQFTDLSQGNIISWYWSFGDGATSGEQNPFHAYPGPGTYEACLTVTGNSNSDTFCRSIVISDTLYQQLYGQVYAGNFPPQQGDVQLFVMNPNGGYTPFGAASPLDSNGVYIFTLVPVGTYLIQAVPYDSSGYLPTYYGDVINWQAATQVVLGVPDNPYNISLVAAGPMSPGPGSVSGQITNGRIERSAVDKINMMLMNESGTAIGFSSVSSSGYFDFRTMDYGIYFLRAELSGAASDNMRFEITAEKPHLDVVLNFSGNSILGVDETNQGKEILTVYPNPVSGQLNMSLNLPESAMINIEIYSMTGQLIYGNQEYSHAGQNLISVALDDYPAGVYTLRVYSHNGINIVKKIIKAD